MAIGKLEFVGDKIKRLRAERRLSQLDVQRMSGVSQSTIIRAERAGSVTERTARRLSRVLGVNPADLLPGGEP